jgi:hypothetical protein
VRTELRNHAAVQDCDQVRVGGDAQPVRDGDRRAPSYDLRDRLADLRLGPRVQRAGRLVEYEDRRVAQQRARDREALTLATAHAHAALAEDRVVARRQ